MRRFVAKFSAIAAACSISLAVNAIAESPATLEIPAGELISALKSLATQLDIELVYQPEQLRSMRTGGVQGAYSPQQAVAILLKGTPLEVHTDTSGAMVISRPVSAASKFTNTTSNAEAPSGSFWGRLRLAQADAPSHSEGEGQGEVSEQTAGNETDAPAQSQKRVEPLQEIVVTGSRLRRVSVEGPQPVNVYEREAIDRSGQSTIADFLNTLPEVATAYVDSGRQTNGGLNTSTVRLRGLPAGSTQVLLNGRRLQSVGTLASTYFDLNLIPAAAVERIEVVPQGSSAVYGSDALAGVVNIVLRKDFDGTQLDANYGFASGIDEQTASVAGGKTWSRGALSVVGTYFDRSSLNARERELLADDDYRRFGSTDRRVTRCNPGNVYSANGQNLPGLTSSQAGIPANLSGRPAVSDFAATAGQLNRCGFTTTQSDAIPATERASAFVHGTYELTQSTRLFSELAYARIRQHSNSRQRDLARARLPAANPFNPFGVDVLIDYRFTREEQRLQFHTDTEFTRALLGAAGSLLGSWEWELVGWRAEDKGANRNVAEATDTASINAALASTNSATAFNPFASGEPASAPIVDSFYRTNVTPGRGRATIATALVRGPIATLAAGDVEVAFGAEHVEERYDRPGSNRATPGVHESGYSRSYFGEARLPILSNASSLGSIALSGALRHDDYFSFGGRLTPQAGLEWRPLGTLLIRGSYAEAYKAPAFSQLYLPTVSFPIPLTDPRRGETVLADTVFAGNPDLEPETGRSHSFGLVWSSAALEGFQVSISSWSVSQENRIAFIGAQDVVNNESLFPALVIRGAGTGNIPGPLLTVRQTFVNFGKLDAAGVDLGLDYRFRTAYGEWQPSLRITQTYHFETALSPGAPPVNRVSAASPDAWAPRWKGIAGLNWKNGPWSAGFDGRYVGEYLDYESRTRKLGDFWLFNANARIEVGHWLGAKSELLAASHLSVGIVNAFDSLPRFSGFRPDSTAYDHSQYDIRGRFVYVSAGLRW